MITFNELPFVQLPPESYARDLGGVAAVIGQAAFRRAAGEFVVDLATYGDTVDRPGRMILRTSTTTGGKKIMHNVVSEFNEHGDVRALHEQGTSGRDPAQGTRTWLSQREDGSLWLTTSGTDEPFSSLTALYARAVPQVSEAVHNPALETCTNSYGDVLSVWSTGLIPIVARLLHVAGTAVATERPNGVGRFAAELRVDCATSGRIYSGMVSDPQTIKLQVENHARNSSEDFILQYKYGGLVGDGDPNPHKGEFAFIKECSHESAAADSAWVRDTLTQAGPQLQLQRRIIAPITANKPEAEEITDSDAIIQMLQSVADLALST